MVLLTMISDLLFTFRRWPPPLVALILFIFYIRFIYLSFSGLRVLIFYFFIDLFFIYIRLQPL